MPLPWRVVVQRTVHLIDASPYIFRGYFSLPAMQAPDGRPVSAIYGFASFLLRYLKEEHPTHVGVCFDESLTTSFRNDIYPEYKAQRELPPPELVEQLAGCQELARALGLAVFVDSRYEADDLVGTLAHQLLSKGHRAVVVSSDKDLAQLVVPELEFFDFARGERYGEAGVVERFGVRPTQIRDYLGLAGDAVDNIPGVRGVGKKTAVALLGVFEDMDALYADLDGVADLDVRGARTLGAKLEASRDLAFLSRELATIATDAPATARLRELAWKGAHRMLVDPLFDMLGFDRIRERIPKWN